MPSLNDLKQCERDDDRDDGCGRDEDGRDDVIDDENAHEPVHASQNAAESLCYPRCCRRIRATFWLITCLSILLYK